MIVVTTLYLENENTGYMFLEDIWQTHDSMCSASSPDEQQVRHGCLHHKMPNANCIFSLIFHLGKTKEQKKQNKETTLYAHL